MSHSSSKNESRLPGDWEVRPLSKDTWADFETLFGVHGACSGCWCMYWLTRGKAFGAGKGEPHKKAMKALADAGKEPGLIGYMDGVPVAWCALSPREAYDRLGHSKTLGRVDDEPVWSLVCFFIAKGYRKHGLATRMLEAAGRHARSRGATILEGYPTDTSGGFLPDPFVFSGLAQIFLKAGFTEVARRSKSRPIFRKKLA
jgi:GNAT superfamily N-acetyltransferase